MKSELAPPATLTATLERVQQLVCENRTRCLWFLDKEFSVDSAETAVLALRYLAQHGDRNLYVEARRLSQWLSANSSKKSAD